MEEILYKNKPAKWAGRYRIPSARLEGWDYRSGGFYFVTICVKGMKSVFGNIKNNEMCLSDIGKMVEQYLTEITNHFSHVLLDEFVVMPNHVHGIVVIDEMFDVNNGRDEALPRLYTGEHPNMADISPESGSLSVIIGSYKSICTKTINKKYLNKNFQWQPRFYDRVIRNNRELENIREYIKNNPVKWGRDRNNLFCNSS